MPNESRKQDMQEGAYPKKKKKSVPGQFAAVKYRVSKKSIGQKLKKPNRQDYGVDKYWVLLAVVKE